MARDKRRHLKGDSFLQRVESERQFSLAIRRIELAEKLGKPLIVMGGIVAMIYFGIYKPIEASHGEETVISFFINWLTDFKLDVALAWGAATSCAGWAIAERKKRLRERKGYNDRIEKYEKDRDPNRSSSNLTMDGTRSRKANDNE